MDTIASLSPFTEQQVRELVGLDTVKVLLVPDPPAPDAVREVVAEADVMIGDMRHQHRLDRDVLASMRRCLLIQQPAVGFDVIDHRAAAEFGIPVVNAAGSEQAQANLLESVATNVRRVLSGVKPINVVNGA